MRTNTPVPIKRSDHSEYPYVLSNVRLCIDLGHQTSTVHAELDFQSKASSPQPLVLHGQALTLISLQLNGQTIPSSHYKLDADTLTLQPDSQQFTVSITTECHPADNTSLMGLYASGDQLFTQCEAEGFRRITWFPDRPDVMAIYQVTLRANKHTYPTLLSNGNLIGQRDLDDGRHEAVWHDPHPKPSYLFALVAGQFALNEKHITTISGRDVLLQIYSDHGTEAKTSWAMDCLERALRWDETTFGLELDLDRFMIVAARDFNMGAMENKGLNIFNASYVLACKDSATDHTYRMIEAVIGHEYFHNWTGNRVTCRDWFQLSLKEGLTVFREQEFSASMLADGLQGDAANSARVVKRIEDVDILRSQQFPEDAGPMAHPIRPESYHEISNFYTATIYEKGAEVIRMLHTLLGPAAFRQGLDEYFHRHDGQAVTCDDFLDAMEPAYRQHHPTKNLDLFRRWYEQAGTPRVSVELEHDAHTQRCTVRLSQQNKAVGIETHDAPMRPKPPLHIPVAIGFISPTGQAIAPKTPGSNHPDFMDPGTGKPGASTTCLLELTEETHTWEFEGFYEKPILSVLRGFSAPVIIDYPRDESELVLLAQHDTDLFVRWQSIQQIITAEILKQAKLADQSAHGFTPLGANIIAVLQDIIDSTVLAHDYRARCLTLVALKQLLPQMQPAQPLAISQAHQHVHCQLGQVFSKSWQSIYDAASTISNQPYRPNPTDAGKRALRSLALGYLLAGGYPGATALATAQYQQANNLSDRLGAVLALTRYAPETDSVEVLNDFYARAGDDAQIVDHWFSVQASAHWATVDSVQALMHHPQFSLRNPNRARSVVFQFCLNNLAGIHTPEGYRYWANQVVELDKLNPEISARLARGLDNWAHYAEPFRSGMHDTLKVIANHTGLSPNVNEIVNKALSI